MRICVFTGRQVSPQGAGQAALELCGQLLDRRVSKPGLACLGHLPQGRGSPLRVESVKDQLWEPRGEECPGNDPASFKSK